MLHDQQLMVRSEKYTPNTLCSPDLEYLTLLCQPFWLPREFTAVVITAVFIPPQADTDAALKELYGHLCKQESVHPDAVFIITEVLNKADLRRIAPKYFQHISWNTLRTDSRPLLHPLPECLQVPPLPTSRQIRSLFRCAPACLQAEVEMGNTRPQDDSPKKIIRR